MLKIESEALSVVDSRPTMVAQNDRLSSRRVAENSANSSRAYESRDIDLSAAAAVIGCAGLSLISSAVVRRQTHHVAKSCR